MAGSPNAGGARRLRPGQRRGRKARDGDPRRGVRHYGQHRPGRAERYHGDRPTVSVQVLGGGSGVGIASLTDGNCDLADSSRNVGAKEVLAIRAKRGEAPKEHIVGYDALAVYVHPDNPLDSISLEELAEIFGDGGKTVRWSQLGIDHRWHGRDTIVRVGRQNSSGTYVYFREAVLGKKRDFKLGSIDRSGSKDVVALVSRTPLAIGYSGMGYATSGVKMLNVARHKGERPVAPTVENACNRSYPLTRRAADLHRGQAARARDTIPGVDPLAGRPEDRRPIGLRARAQVLDCSTYPFRPRGRRRTWPTRVPFAGERVDGE